MGLFLVFLALTLLGAPGQAVNPTTGAVHYPSLPFLDRIHHDWLEWGPFRPGLYFGVRPTSPDTMLFGLMWSSGNSRELLLDYIRDTCQHDKRPERYGWTVYDTRVGGIQRFYDTRLNLVLKTKFFKTGNSSWAVRVSGRPLRGGRQDERTTIVFHAAMETEKDTTPGDYNSWPAPDFEPRKRKLKCSKFEHAKLYASCRGDIDNLGGKFWFDVHGDASGKSLHDIAVRSMNVSENQIWETASLLKEVVNASPNNSLAIESAPGPGNLHFIQMTFEGPFTATLTFNGDDEQPLNASQIEDGLKALTASFPKTVRKVFPVAPFGNSSPNDNLTALSQIMSHSMISNLLGGLGYFNGESQVDLTNAAEYAETTIDFWKDEALAQANAIKNFTSHVSLLTHTPSRSKFPHGFLWDEGFHLLPVLEWDLDLAVFVIQSWFKLMNREGWIAREQILDPDAYSRVPEELQTQYPHHANPPTLLLLFPIIISKLNRTSPYYGHDSKYMSSEDEALKMLKSTYPWLVRHYDWFRKTQAGNFTSTYPRPSDAIPVEAYRWRGRQERLCLASGLGDYPRPEPPHPGELHVDALSWVGASAHALQQVASFLGRDDDAKKYAQQVSSIKHNLEAIHWSPEKQTYCDVTIDPKTKDSMHDCHEGYLSLFPLLLGLMNSSHPNLPTLLDLMSDPSRLWSPHGLRSLSKSDPGYHREGNYWRGHIWINLNVLAVLRLRDLGLENNLAPTRTTGEDQNNSLQGKNTDRTNVQTRALELASRLRTNLLRTVMESWGKTESFWQRYDDRNGKGLGSEAFTGWTACLLLLLRLDFDGVPFVDKGDADDWSDDDDVFDSDEN